MTAELILVVTIAVLSGALFLWVARTRSSSLTKESTHESAGHGLLSLPKTCYDFCRQNSRGNENACDVTCSLLQE